MWPDGLATRGAPRRRARRRPFRAALARGRGGAFVAGVIGPRPRFSAPGRRSLPRRLGKLQRRAQAPRLGARVARHLAGARAHRAAGDQLRLGLAPAHADGQVRRADAAAGAVDEEALHHPVLERVEGDRGHAAARAQQRPRGGQRALERLQLVVDRDPDRLEHASRRVPGGELRRRGDRALDRVDQLGRGLDRRRAGGGARSRARCRARSAPRRTRGRSRASRASGHSFTTVRASSSCGGVHAHVERRVVGVGEAALARVHLHRGDAEVQVERGRPRAPPRAARAARRRSRPG